MSVAVVLATALFPQQQAAAQPGAVGANNLNGSPFSCTNLTDLGAFRQARIQATQSSSGVTWEFPATCSYPGDVWRPYAGGTGAVPFNTIIPPVGGTGSALYNSGNGGASGTLAATTNGRYYTFNVEDKLAPNNLFMSVLETTFNPVAISSITQADGALASRTITITTSATPATGENIYVRYSTNSFTTSTLVQATGSGTTWTATIPWQSTTVLFYAYSSNKALVAINADVTAQGQVAHDMATLTLNNNIGANYSWTPAAGPIIVTSTGGTAANTPTSYSTFTTATTGLFAVLNGGTVHTGTVSVVIVADVTEPATTPLNASAAWTAMTINPSGARTVSGAAAAGTPLIDLSGADNVTIDGLNTGGNSLTIENTTLSATSGTSTIRFINGATNNTITNCSLKGAVSSSVLTNGAVVFFSTDGSTANGNDNNTISNNNIGPSGANLPSKAIQGNGSTTTTAIGNSGIVIDNNNIFDFFSATTTSAGVAINGGCNTWSITNNRFYQTATRTWTTGALHTPIVLNSSTATSGVQGMTVTGNIIGYASNTQTGTYAMTGSTGSFRGISFAGITAGTVSNINNNTIASVSLTGVTSFGTSTSSPFMAIYIANGNVTSNSNTIGSQSATGSLTFSTNSINSTDIYGIYNFSVDNWTANSNNIGGISVTNAAASGTYIIYGMRANTGTSLAFSATSNNVGGTVANSIQLNSTGASSQVVGMLTSNAQANWTSNTVRNLTNNNGTGTTSSASVIGMSVSTSTPNHTLSQNTIFNLSNTNTTAATVVTGIQFTGGSANIVERNFIYGLTTATSSTSAEINGIRVAGGTTVYRNNMIALGDGISNAIGAAASNSGTTGINGINEALGTNTFWHNSVYIGGTATAGTGASYAFNGTQTTNTRSFRDNIFQNARTNSGATGKHYAVKINGTTPNPTGLTINNNLYFANGTGAVFGFFNSLDIANIAGWRGAVGQDVNSFESNPQFNNPTGATPDLHLHPTNATVAEGNGTDLGVTDDYDGQTRSGLTPVDIGADAGNFIGLDLAPPSITYTALGNTCSTTDRSLTATITDVTGVPTGGPQQPRIYYRKNAGPWFSSQGSLTSGTAINGTWTFTIVVSDMGGVAASDAIQYYVIAQDISGNITSNPATGLVAASVNTVTTAPTTPNSYNIQSTLAAGTYQIPGSFATLTAAVAAYNTSCLTGAVVFELAAGYSSVGEAFPITINANPDASATNTLTIRPAAGQTPIISGSSTTGMIVVNGADYVIIDGSNASVTNSCCPLVASTRDLTISNTNTSASAVVWLQSTGTNGATNNKVRNCILAGGSVTTSYGVWSGSSTLGTAATAANNNTVIENNDIRKVRYGVVTIGVSAASKNTGTQITQNLMNNASPNHVGDMGINVQFDDGATISCNNIANLATGNSSADCIGISVGGTGAISTSTTTSNEVTNATIARNVIGNFTAASTYSAAGIWVNSAATGTTTLANNIIYQLNSNGTGGDFAAGIWVGGGAQTTRVWFNTVDMNKTFTGGAYPSFALAISGSNSVVDVRNNILTSTGSTGANLNRAIGLNFALPASNLTMDYNNLFVSGTGSAIGQTTNLTSSGAVSHTTLSNWQTNSGKDANSKNVSPVFVSATDLHLNTTNASNISNLMTGGTPLSVTDDIDCATRNGSTPTIGADEFSVPDCSGVPSAGTSSPASTTVCASQTVAMSNNASNLFTGITYQWQVSTVSGGPYTDVTGGTGATTQNYTTGTLTAGTYYYVLRLRCGNVPIPTGDSYSNEVAVTVNALPAVGVSPTGATYCAGGAAVALTADGANSYSWAPATGLSATTGATVNASPNATTTYTVTGTDGNGCQNTATSTITYGGLQPAVQSVTATPATICAGGSSNLNVTAGTVVNTPPAGGSIAIPSSGNATPYPGTIAVSGLSGGVSNVRVTITNFSHTFASDVDVVLFGPTGAHSIIFTDAIGTSGITGRTYTFQTGATALPLTGLPASGTYGVVNGGSFGGSGTPSAVTNTGLGVFNGTNPNGTWSLYVFDDATGDAGSIGSWSLEITTGAAVSTYSWSPATYLNSTTVQNPTANNALATTAYTVTVTSATGCSATGNVTLNVNPLPTVTCGGPYTPLCIGQVSPIVGSPSGGTWSGPGVTGTGPYLFDSGVSGVGTFTLTYTYTDGNGCTNSCQTNMTVNPLPTATAGGGGAVCSTDPLPSVTFTFTGTPPFTFTYSGPGGTTVSGYNSNTYTITNATAGTYAVTAISDFNNCVGTDFGSSATVTVNQAATANAGSAQTVCEGGTVTLAGSIGGSATSSTWSAPSGTFSDASSLTSTYTPSITSGTVTLTLTTNDPDGAGPCTAATSTVVITVNPLPVASIVSNGGPICSGGNAVFTVTGTSGATLTFNTGGANQNLSLNGANQIITVTGATANTTLTLLSVATSGSPACINTFSPAPTSTVTVNALPVVTCPVSSNVCLSTPAFTLSGGSPAGGTYSGAGVSGGSFNPATAGVGTHTITYTYTNPSTGCTNSCAFQITVNQPLASAGNNGPVCIGGTLNLSATGGSTYLWSGPLSFSSNQQNPAISGATLAMSGTYTVTVTSIAGCTATAATTVSVVSTATASITGNTTYCAGGTISITASGGTSYQWSGPGGYTQNGATLTRLNANTGMTGTYTVTVSTAGGCLATASTFVTVNAAPAATITASGATTFCAGGSVTLTAGGGVSYLWNNGLTSASITVTQGATYFVTVTNSNGCTASTNLKVTVNPVPTATITASGATTFCTGGSVNLTVTGSGTYLWSTGSTAATIAVNASGT
ncbi:hypothetical protein C7N43_05120, partial [Sphingobacteriales bacterium UPWRP_1]